MKLLSESGSSRRKHSHCSDLSNTLSMGGADAGAGACVSTEVHGKLSACSLVCKLLDTRLFARVF
jgi:hypothetical protein